MNRTFAIALLQDDHGIGDKAFDQLEAWLVETEQYDIMDAVRCADGRYYLPDCWPGDAAHADCKLRYHISYCVVLSCEECYNAGLDPEQVKLAIETTADPAVPATTPAWLRAEPTGLNHNWQFRIEDERLAAVTVAEITTKLQRMLNSLRMAPRAAARETNAQ